MIQPWSSSMDREGGELRGIAILQRHCRCIRPDHPTCGRAALCLTSHSFIARDCPALVQIFDDCEIRSISVGSITTRSGRRFQSSRLTGGRPRHTIPSKYSMIQVPSTQPRAIKIPTRPDQYRICSDNRELNALLCHIAAELSPTPKERICAA